MTCCTPLHRERSDLTPPLLNRDPLPEDALARCVWALHSQAPLEDTHRCARRSLIGSAVVIASGAKIPYFPIALQWGPVVGPISAIGNSLGFFILEYWAITATINTLFGAKTQAEQELMGKTRGQKRSLCYNVAVIGVSTLIALSSQIPIALPGIQYNAKQYKIAAGIVLLIAGALVPARSLQLSIDHLRSQVKSSFAAEVAKLQRKMSALIRAHHEIFIGKQRAEKQTFIETIDAIRRRDPPEQVHSYMLEMSKSESVPVSRVTGIARKVFQYTGLGLGALSAGLFEYALGEYTFQVSKLELYDNAILAGFFATLAVSSTAYLFGMSLMNTTQRIFNVCGHLVTGGSVRNLSWQLRPALSFALTAIGCLIDVCALGPTYIIWGNFYKENAVEHALFLSTLCTSLFLLLFTSTLDVIDDVVTHCIARGSEEEKALVRIHREFQQLANLVEQSPAPAFIAYVSSMPREEQETLLDRLSLTSQQLTTYVDSLYLQRHTV